MTLQHNNNYPAEAVRYLLTGCLLLSMTYVNAGPIGLPDSARPGAERPEMKVPVEAPDETPQSVPAAVSASDPGAQVEIPAMIDRPFDIEEGPYVMVDEFRLIDAENLPDFGIDLEEVMFLLDKQLEQQPERGFSIGELQEVSDVVTRYYRERGLILSTAVLPVQTVTDGTVDIQVLVGKLGRVIAESNEDYSEEKLREPFLKLIGQPITQESIESALLTLTDYPGLSVFGVFQPGQKVGEADIILKVQEEKWYDVAYRADNHGLPETGRSRFRTVVDWNNMIGMADRLTASFQQTYNPKNNEYWALDYEVYFGDGYRFNTGTYKNNFDIGGDFAVNQISAETTTDTFGLSKSFIRSRRENLALNAILQRRFSETRTAGLRTNQDRLTTISFGLDYDSVDTYHPFRPLLSSFTDVSDSFGGGLNFATFAMTRGFNDLFGAMGSSADQLEGIPSKRSSRRGASGRLAEGQFFKVAATYQRLQLMTRNTSFLFRTEFQWTDDLLVPLEQYSVGGPENVRGFPDAQGLFDKSYFISFEYIFNAPFFADKPAFMNRTWGEILQLSAFYDFATSQQLDALDTAQDRNTSGKWVTHRSWGVGLRFNLPNMIDSRLMFARPLGPEVPNNERPVQVWGDLTYSF